MPKYLILIISVLAICLMLGLYCQSNIIDSKTFAQLHIPNMRSNISSIATSVPFPSDNNAAITFHSTNSIQGNNFVIKQEVLLMQYIWLKVASRAPSQ